MSLEAQRNAAERIIREHMIVAMGAGLVPVPFADWATTTAVQINLVRKLAEVYKIPFFSGLAKGLIASLVGATTVRGGATLVKLIPGIGWLVGGLTASVLAAATTYAIGKVFQTHFEAGGTLKDFDLEAAQRAYKHFFQQGQQEAENLKKGPQDKQKTPSYDATYDQLQKLYELYQKGILTAEEYETQKRRLLERL
ncbi:MAG: DUF697 domain-containing protein [Bacteroidia bacterium]|nr:DUF697 domain-containing protein [Bacteroidia bacterium]MDW8088155.1 DUF697 domain-containing protein [Bacteroidia bacterium]